MATICSSLFFLIVCVWVCFVFVRELAILTVSSSFLISFFLSVLFRSTFGALLTLIHFKIVGQQLLSRLTNRFLLKAHSDTTRKNKVKKIEQTLSSHLKHFDQKATSPLTLPLSLFHWIKADQPGTLLDFECLNSESLRTSSKENDWTRFLLSER